MADLFKMTIRLDSQSMTEFGTCVGKVCCEYPTLVLAEIEALRVALLSENPDFNALLGALDRLRANTILAVNTGNALAAVIGVCTPVRIDGGTLQ